MKTLKILTITATLLALQGCDDNYPDPEWKVGIPEEHGVSSTGLEQMALVAEQFNTSCMMVIHNGVLLGEWYWDGFDRYQPVSNVFSVTKSVTSTLTGIAQAQNLLHLDDKAFQYIETWKDTPSAEVSIRNLVSNDSGRYWSIETDYLTGMMTAPDQTQYAVDLTQQFDPGTVWEYNNSAIQTLDAVLSAATGENIVDYARTQLFQPIGAKATMANDPSGNTLTYQGVSGSCDDMARFGYLALRKGRWKDKQIVPAQWFQEATMPSTPLNDAYGYMWWLNNDGHVVEPSFPNRVEYDGKLIPAAPEDVYAAIGAFGQFIVIDPVGDYVIVRLSNITDIYNAMATSVDPVGLTQMRSILKAFEEAKI